MLERWTDCKRQLARAAGSNGNSALVAARWRMKAGDLDGMFRELDRAFDARTVWMPAVKWYINSPAAKRDPRFGALLARLHIPEDAR